MTGLTRITTYKVDKYDNNSTAGDTRGVAAVDFIIGYDVAVDGYGGVGKNDRDDQVKKVIDDAKLDENTNNQSLGDARGGIPKSGQGQRHHRGADHCG